MNAQELTRALGSEDAEERRRAAARLSELEGGIDPELLRTALGDPDWRVRKEATHAAVAAARARLRAANLPEALMIDCSHGNSEKRPERQLAVVEDVLAQRLAGQMALKALIASRSEERATPNRFMSSRSEGSRSWGRRPSSRIRLTSRLVTSSATVVREKVERGRAPSDANANASPRKRPGIGPTGRTFVSS